MELWQLAILAIGGNAALLVVLGGLAKSFLAHLLEKDVKRYELTLKAQTDLALERFKSEQQLRAAEHQVRFSRLHETRAELIAAFYKAVVEFERYFRVHAHPENQLLTSDEGGKHSKTIGALYGSLEALYSNNRVFFNVDTCHLVDSLLEALVSVRDLNIAVPVSDSRDSSPVEAIRIPSWAGISAKITPVKADLEANFRQILGVQG
jgi:hypothetical protein